MRNPLKPSFSYVNKDKANVDIFLMTISIYLAVVPTVCTNKKQTGEQTMAVLKKKTPSLIKGGYLDFSHLTVLKSIHIIEIYEKKKNNTNHQ